MLSLAVGRWGPHLRTDPTTTPALQDVRKSPFRRSEHNMMADLQTTVTGLTAELSAKDTTIRALEVRSPCPPTARSPSCSCGVHW